MDMNARLRTSSKETKKNIKYHLKHLKVLQPHVKYEEKKIAGLVWGDDDSNRFDMTISVLPFLLKVYSYM